MFVYHRKVCFIDYYIKGIRSGNVGIVRQKVAEDILWLKTEWSGGADKRADLQRIAIVDTTGKEICYEMKLSAEYNQGIFQIPIKELNPDKSKKIIFYFGNESYGIADLCCLPEEKAVYDREEIKENELVRACEESSESLEESIEESIEESLGESLEEQSDKWEMIKRKYPILYPFKGQGPYVSIKPVDLQLLNQKYRQLSNNSYLMHGFYRYRHMILGEYSTAKGTFFYVGVPGEFVTKEQTSAAMFGFEGYEHSGDLGYYLYRVEL